MGCGSSKLTSAVHDPAATYNANHICNSPDEEPGLKGGGSFDNITLEPSKSDQLIYKSDYNKTRSLRNSKSAPNQFSTAMGVKGNSKIRVTLSEDGSLLEIETITLGGCSNFTGNSCNFAEFHDIKNENIQGDYDVTECDDNTCNTYENQCDCCCECSNYGNIIVRDKSQQRTNRRSLMQEKYLARHRCGNRDFVRGDNQKSIRNSNSICPFKQEINKTNQGETAIQSLYCSLPDIKKQSTKDETCNNINKLSPCYSNTQGNIKTSSSLCQGERQSTEVRCVSISPSNEMFPGGTSTNNCSASSANNCCEVKYATYVKHKDRDKTKQMRNSSSNSNQNKDEPEKPCNNYDQWCKSEKQCQENNRLYNLQPGFIGKSNESTGIAINNTAVDSGPMGQQLHCNANSGAVHYTCLDYCARKCYNNPSNFNRLSSYSSSSNTATEATAKSSSHQGSINHSRGNSVSVKPIDDSIFNKPICDIENYENYTCSSSNLDAFDYYNARCDTVTKRPNLHVNRLSTPHSTPILTMSQIENSDFYFPENGDEIYEECAVDYSQNTKETVSRKSSGISSFSSDDSSAINNDVLFHGGSASVTFNDACADLELYQSPVYRSKDNPPSAPPRSTNDNETPLKTPIKNKGKRSLTLFKIKAFSEDHTHDIKATKHVLKEKQSISLDGKPVTNESNAYCTIDVLGLNKFDVGYVHQDFFNDFGDVYEDVYEDEL